MQVGGIPELIEHDVNGLLTTFGDIDAFAQTVEQLIDDPDRRMAFGEAAKRCAVERFSADVIVPQYEDLYRRVCPQAD